MSEKGEACWKKNSKPGPSKDSYWVKQNATREEVSPRKLVKQESISQKAELMTLGEENTAQSQSESSETESAKTGKPHELVKQKSLMLRAQVSTCHSQLVRQSSIQMPPSSSPDPLNQAFVEPSDDDEVVCLSSSEPGQDLSDDQSTPDLETVMSTCKNPTERSNCMKFVRDKSRDKPSQ